MASASGSGARSVGGSSSSASDGETLALFLRGTLETLQQRASKRKDDELNRACVDMLGKVTRVASPREESSWIYPLVLGVNSNDKKTAATALNGIQKLVAFGLLNGSLRFERTGETVADTLMRGVVHAFGLNENDVHMALVKMVVTCLTSDDFDVHDDALLDAFRCCYNVVLVSRSRDTQVSAKVGLFQILDSVMSKFVHPSYKDFEDDERRKMSAVLRDGLHVMRALCKLTTKETPGKSAPTDAFIQNKVLAMELVQHILQSHSSLMAGNVFFVATLKKYLVTGILRTILCGVPVLFQHSMNLVLALFQGYRNEIRGELFMLFSNVFVKVIKGRKSTASEKIITLQLLSQICEDPNVLADVFLGAAHEPATEGGQPVPAHRSPSNQEFETELRREFCTHVTELRAVVVDLVAMCGTRGTPDQDLVTRCGKKMDQLVQYYQDDELDPDGLGGMSTSITMQLSHKPVNEEL